MDVTEHAARIRELAEERAARETAQRHAHDAHARLRLATALTVGGLAVLLAVASLKGDETSLHAGVADRRANSSWAQYQAKRTRQLDHELAIEAMERELLVLGAAAGSDVRQRFAMDVEHARAEIQRLEDEPDAQDPGDPAKGDGKVQIAARASQWEHERDVALDRIPNFHYAETLLQIAAVLCSVAIVSASHRWLVIALAGGVAAVLLLANGLFFVIPIAGGH